MRRLAMAGAILAAVVSVGPVPAAVSGGTTSDRVVLRIALLGLAIDVQPGYLRISEVLHLSNPTSRTFAADLTIPLPRGARFITFHEGLRRPRVEGDQILDRLMIRPGAHQVAYSYSLAGAGEVALDRRISLPVERLEIFTSAPAETQSPVLRSGPMVTTEGRLYTRASGRGLPPGILSLTVVGVPAARLWPAPVAAATLAGMLIVGLAWAVMRTGSGRGIAE